MRKSLFWLMVTTIVFAQTLPDGPQFTSAGELLLPKNYRQWTYLSSGLGMTYGPAVQNGPAEPLFDNVFVNPSSYREFLKTGRWPDKTMTRPARDATDAARAMLPDFVVSIHAPRAGRDDRGSH